MDTSPSSLVWPVVASCFRRSCMAYLCQGKSLLYFRTMNVIAYCDGNDVNICVQKWPFPMAIGDCIVCTVQLCVVVTKLGEVCLKWFILLGSASTELAKDVLSANIISSCVQAGI